MRSPAIIFLSLVSVGVSLPFSEWLDQLRLNIADIPQITLDLPTGGSAVIDIQNGTCHDISLGVLSVADAIGSTSGFATNFTLDGLGLKCEIQVANAEIKTGLLPINSGPLDITFAILPGLVSAGLVIPAAQNEAAPLPEGANLTACSAPLVLSLRATGHTISGRSAASIINAAAAELTPDLLSNTICGTVGALVDGRINETLRNVSSELVASGALNPAEDAPEPTMSTSATNINELMQTGDFGRAWQALIHHGRYDMSNTTQLVKLISGIGQILHPNENSQLKRFFDGVEQLAAMEGTVPFSFKSAVGGLTGGLSLGTCGGGPLPSPILAGMTTEHAQRFTTGQFNGHCGADVNFTLNPRTLELGNGSTNISLVFGELDVTTNLMAAVEGLSVYLSLLTGIDGYTMVDDYSSDQWFTPGCLIHMLDEDKPENLRLLGLTGAIAAVSLDLAALDQDPTLGGLLQGVSQWVNALLEAYQPVLDLLLKGSGTSSVVNSLNGKVQEWLTSQDECAPSGYTDPVDKTMVVGSSVWTAVFAGFGLVVAVAFLVQCSLRRRKVEMGRTLLTASSDEASPAAREASTDSLSAQARGEGAVSATVLSTASWTMNLLLLGVMGLLLLSVVVPTSRLQNTVMDTDPLGGGPHTQTGARTLEFTLWSLAMDMGRYGLPAMTVLIVLGNIVNPLCQLVILLSCWNLPPSALSVKKRGETLAILVLTMKCNLLGTFLNAVLAISMTSALIHDDGAGGTTRLIMETAPEIGFYLYTVAILASLVLCEIISSTHLRMFEAGSKKVAAGSGVGQGGLEAGGAAAAAVEGDSEVLLSRVPLYLQVERSAISALTWLFALATPVIVICGLWLDSFSVGMPGCFQGALRWWLGNEVSSDYSIVKATAGFPWPTQATGALPLQMGYFLIMVVVAWFLIVGPILLSLMHVICWAVPLTPSGHKRARILAQYLFNWQALEVYILTVIGMSLLDTLLSRALNAMSSGDSALSGLCTGFEDDDVKCINLEINLLSGMWVLGAAVVSTIVTKTLIERQSKSALGE